MIFQLSFASVAGLPPVYGLYNSISGCIPYFFFGTSPHLIVGPTAVMSLLVRTAVPRETSEGVIVDEASAQWIGFATTMSFLAGLFQVLMGLFGLGVFVQLVSEPVMQGFVTASALLMIISQTAGLLGLPKCNASDLLGEGHDYDECYLQEYIASITKHADKIHLTTTILSAFSIVLLVGTKYFLTKTKPAILSKMGPILLVAISLPWFYFLAQEYGTVSDEKGRVFDKKWHVRLVGPIPSGLPEPSSPFDAVPSFRDTLKVFTSSLVIALLGFMESMAIASAVSRQTKMGRLVPSRELLALGASNLLCSVTRGYPITGSFSRTAVNAESGARTKLSSLISGLVVALVLVAFSGLMQYMPKFALAAIVVVGVLNLIKPKDAWILYKTRKLDFFSFFFVVAITMIGGFERGLASGVFISWVGTMLHRNPAKLELLRLDHDSTFIDVPSSGTTVSDVAILSLDSSLLFSNVTATENAAEAVYSMFRPQCLIIDVSKCATVDASGIQVLNQLGEFAFDFTEAKSLYVTGAVGDTRRVIERAVMADDRLQWVLAPVVGGIPDGMQPHVLFFDSVEKALDFLKGRIVGKNPDDPLQMFSPGANEIVEQARLASWRQGGNEADVDPGWRIPSFARSEPFELMVRHRDIA